MNFEANYLIKTQEKLALHIIKDVKNYLKTDHLSYTILGLNPTDSINELEESKLGKDKKEIKAIDSRIANMRFFANNTVKLIFNLDNKLRQLAVIATIQSTQSYYTIYYVWTGLLEFSISNQLIFGRADKKPSHKSGKYFFAPTEFRLPDDLIKKIDQDTLEDKFEHKILLLASANPLIDLLESMRHSREAFDQMKTMLQLVNSKQETEIQMIDKLNINKQLVNDMKSVGHFGATEFLLFKHVSEVDVSTICLPLPLVTLIQIADYESTHKRVLKAFFSLSDALQEFEVKRFERRWTPAGSRIKEPTEEQKVAIPSSLNQSDVITPEVNQPVSSQDLLEEEGETSEFPSTVKDRSEAEIQAIIAGLNDADPETRLQKVELLGKIGNKMAVKPLVNILLNDPSSNIRAKAAVALGLIGDKIIVPVLRRVMTEDPDPTVRENAVDALNFIEGLDNL